MDDKSPKKNTLADEYIAGISSTLEQIALKTVHKDKEGDWWRKRSKTLNEIKPVENIYNKTEKRKKIQKSTAYFLIKYLWIYNRRLLW